MSGDSNDGAIAVVDYGMGNLQSVLNAFEVLGHDALLIEESSELDKASAVVVPGVGAFRDGMDNLRKRGFVEALERAVLDEGTPFLGVCLGLQILAEESEEHGKHQGLGWLKGTVRRIDPTDPEYSVPHMGWNEVASAKSDEVLFADLDDGTAFYFVHSYHLVPTPEAEDRVTTTAWHGDTITASVRKDHIFGVQFHPEKSQAAGLKLYENFVNFVDGRG